jgi:uncharacterized protein YukE
VSAGWAAVFPDLGGDPVQGRPQEFRNAADQFAELQERSQGVADEFTRIRSGAATAQFAGESAEAFKVVLADVDCAVQTLPRVASGIRSTFASHATELEVLRRRAAEALARAQTNWSAAGRARCELDQANARRSTILDQIRSLELASCAGSPDADAQLERRYGDLRLVECRIGESRTALRSAEGGLHDARVDWNHLKRDEHDLDARTAKALRHQELWSLGDPSTIEQLGAATVRMLKDLYEFGVLGVLESVRDILEFVTSDEFLWALYDALEVVTLVLSVATLIAVVVAVLVPPLAPVLAPVAGVLKGVDMTLGLLKLAVGVALFQRKSVSPDGRTISPLDLAFDVVGLLAGSGVKVLRGLKISTIEANKFLFRPVMILAKHPRAIDVADDVVSVGIGSVKFLGGIDPSSLTTGPYRSTGIPQATDACRSPSVLDGLRQGALRVVPAGAGGGGW